MVLITVILLTCAQLLDLTYRIENSQLLTPSQKTEIIEILNETAHCSVK